MVTGADQLCSNENTYGKCTWWKGNPFCILFITWLLWMNYDKTYVMISPDEFGLTIKTSEYIWTVSSVK